MVKNLSNHTSRGRAAALIERWLETEAFPDRLLADLTTDRAFLMELFYGIVRWKRLLDWVIARYVSHKPEPAQQAFLLVGLYQLLKMTSVPAYAAVHETVAAAKAALGARQANFINALLRRTLREKDGLLTELSRQPLGIRQSHPDELLTRWIRHFGLKPTEALCAWNNQPSDIIIRVNRLKTTPEAYLRQAAAGGLSDRLRPRSPAGPPAIAPGATAGCFTLAHGLRVEDLPGYREGHFLVIDPAAAQAVDLLAPRPGEQILDACAAPGGKTALIAESLRLKGRLVALDSRADRLGVLRANLERLGCARFVQVALGDARRLSPDSFGRFDRILLDVPCSNTGVIRRKPDVRWRFSPARLKRLAQTQRELLDSMAALVKRGGRIVYSTCSLEPEENEELINAWLKVHSRFRLERSYLSWPPDSGQDGAYAALLKNLR